MAGQSDPHLSLFSAPEVEFIAEDEMLEIVPNVKMGALHMICIAVRVPLWLAVAMKKRGKCAIRPPDWLSVGNLTQVLEAERESPREFQPLPFHYVEISRLLFDHASDDIPDTYMLKNLSAMEVNIVRPFMVRTLQAFYKHDNPEMVQQQETVGNRRPQVADRGPRRDLRPR